MAGCAHAKATRGDVGAATGAWSPARGGDYSRPLQTGHRVCRGVRRERLAVASVLGVAGGAVFLDDRAHATAKPRTPSSQPHVEVLKARRDGSLDPSLRKTLSSINSPIGLVTMGIIYGPTHRPT